MVRGGDSACMLCLRARRGLDGLRHSAQTDGTRDEDVCRTVTRVERNRAREGQAELSTGQGISHHNRHGAVTDASMEVPSLSDAAQQSRRSFLYLEVHAQRTD